MTESECTQLFQKSLRHCGYKVFKHCDRFTKGVPDTSASKNHMTTWYEFKAIRVKTPQDSVDWNKILEDKDMVQLANMLELERKALANYILFQIFPRNHTIHIIMPTEVNESIREKKLMRLPSAWTLEDLETIWQG